MLNAGVTLQMLPHLTDEHLRLDCGIKNGIHRLQILQAAEGEQSNKLPPATKNFVLAFIYMYLDKLTA